MINPGEKSELDIWRASLRELRCSALSGEWPIKATLDRSIDSGGGTSPGERRLGIFRGQGPILVDHPPCA